MAVAPTSSAPRKNEWKAQDVVDLVRIVGPPGADNGVRPHGANLFGHNLRHRVGQRHDHGFRSHASALFGTQHVRPGKAEKDLCAVDRIVQGSRAGVPGEGGLVRLRVTPFVDEPFDVDQPDILAFQPEVQKQIQAGDAGCPAAGRNQLDPAEVLAQEMHAVDDGGGDDDGGAVLVVVEDGDVHLRLQPVLDLETIGRLDVFQIDGAESRFESPDRVGQGVGIALVDLDVEHVYIGESL